MEVIHTTLKDCFVLKPEVFEDNRGYFFGSYNENNFSEITGLNVTFVLDNQSFSKYGVVRGLHAQSGVHAQAKLVRVLKGEVLDVAVDARPGSPTFGQHVAVKLNEENKLQLFVPRGFLHGFSVLSETAVVFYKCDNYYNKESEQGIIYNDPALNISWEIPDGQEIVSDKDMTLPTFDSLTEL